MPLKNLVKKTLYKHFCGGESILECNESARQLQKFNIGAILDYAVEGEANEAAFERTAEELLNLIDKASKLPNIPFTVFKPTGIASRKIMAKLQAGEKLDNKEAEDFEKTKERFNAICQRAFDRDVRLFVDSEDSWYQDTVDVLVYVMMRMYNKEKAIIFNTYQMYRVDMPLRLSQAYDTSIREGYYFGAKLVRGAYMEKERKQAAKMGYPDPIFPNKKLTDTAFDEALDFCVERKETVSVCCGSHNEESNYRLVRLIHEHGMERHDERAYFAQLYGMSDHISYNLARAGYNVAKYMPYGPIEAVIPYLIRRAEENTAIAGQSSRELQLIKREMRRRKLERKKTSR